MMALLCVKCHKRIGYTNSDCYRDHTCDGPCTVESEKHSVHRHIERFATDEEPYIAPEVCCG